MSNLPQLPLNYLHLPSRSENVRHPLFLLHGYGSNEEDLFSFAGDLNRYFEVFSLRAPLNLPPFGYAWYEIDFEAPQGKWSNLEQADASLNLLRNFLDEAAREFGFPLENISLLGFSQGCILSLALALRHPHLFSRVVGLSGYLNRELLPDLPDWERIRQLRIYNSHGTEDPVIPVDWARETPRFLESQGVRVQYEEYPSGHGVAPDNYNSFLTWLTQDLSLADPA